MGDASDHELRSRGFTDFGVLRKRIDNELSMKDALVRTAGDGGGLRSGTKTDKRRM